ncbi:MAG: sucrase ferredoxin, partial [Cyanobacteria bacterium J06607_6]
MSEQTLTTDCQFCSVVSKINREDPIGTVGTYDYWIVTELAQPWSEE